MQVAVARVLAEATSADDSKRRVLPSIGATLGWELGAMWTVDDAGGLIRCEDVWKRGDVDAPAFEEASREAVFERGVGLPGRVWESGEPAWIRDVADDDNFPRARVAGQSGIHGAFGFPIRSRRGVIGVIEYFTADHAEPDRYLLDLMETIGYQLGEQMERSRAEEAVRESEARKSAMLEASLDCIVSMDHRGNVVEFNAAAERTFGWSADEVVGREMCELIIPPSLREAHRNGLERYLETGEGEVINNRIEIVGMHRSGREFPVELTIVRAPLAGPPLFTGFIRDISERKRRQAFDRFMAEAGALLGASVDYETTLEAVAGIAVPSVADWCAIDLLTEDGAVRRVAGTHADRTKADLVASVGKRWPARLNDPYGPGKVIRSGEVEHLREIPDSMLVSIASGDEERLRVLRELAPRSGVTVPLQTVPGRILGSLSLFTCDGEASFDAVDVALATEVGRRCAVAVENARLYRERDWIARTLQQSLLPPDLPEIPGVALEARFRPAGEGIEMGGDFYDAFEVGEHAWALTIGDVCGKGPDAAALTALVRYTLRAVTMHERQPERALELVNRAILRNRSDDRFCSAALAIVETRPDGVHVELASAGHPLPLLLHPDGRVEAIGARGHLLGLWPDFEAEPLSLLLAPGDALIFYTDGVTDARAPDRILDTDDLAELVRSCAGAGAEATAERIERTVADSLAGEPRDDIAVLVIEAQGPRDPVQEEVSDDELDGALRLSIPSSPHAPARARRAIEALSGSLDSDVVEQLKLLATELVTNSCRHAAAKGDPIGVVLAVDEGVVRLSVTDTGPGFAAPDQIASPDDESGRGLLIVDVLADRWGVDARGGTRVWCELEAAPSTERTAASGDAWGVDRSGAPGL
ncbi:MAG: SpoIIE family protein phosphatase [Actinomycetota bacterium]|nr:SpoIIE family protein phosphatase [Actinomycetota bacterium]